MTWTLTDHNVGPLSSLGLGCGYTGGALLMAGGRVHECGPFEARQVHEERQGPDIRGTEGACPAPLPLCGHMHVGNRISTGRSHTSGESCIPGASHMHLIIWGLDLDLGPWHSTQHSILDTALGTALGAQHGADTANPLSTTLYTAPRLPCPVSRLRTFNRIVRRSKRGGAGLFCVALSLQPATFATTAEPVGMYNGARRRCVVKPPIARHHSKPQTAPSVLLRSAM